MDMHDATEQAYRNGWQAGFESGHKQGFVAGYAHGHKAGLEGRNVPENRVPTPAEVAAHRQAPSADAPTFWRLLAAMEEKEGN